MERFNLDKKLPSVFVDKKLLLEVEKYLTDRLPEKLSKTLEINENTKFKYFLVFKDGFGEEHIDTIQKYHRDKMANGLEYVSINYSIDFNKLDIRIKFSKSFTHSDLQIDLHSNGARETAMGIYRELLDIVNNQKTIHSFFYNYPVYIAWALAAITPSLFSIKFPYSNQIWFFVWLCSITFFPIRLLAPYSTFATFKREKIERAISWVLNGMAGVFLFGVIAMMIRDKIF